ncbi:MAG: FAD-binding oxidoreductase, partial [Planctomycetes bacterium]|nr:FAD-binding oxidoreductase [Planctomycetota bacterium]
TPDGLPYLARPPQFNNLTIAAGHGMIGLSLGPITGKLVAQLVTNQKTSIDLKPLRIDRFN